MFKTRGGCCLERFVPEHVQNPRRVLLRGVRMWARPLYDEKVFKTDRFQHDFVMVLDGYQFLEFSGNRAGS